jgi:hypothetical protein
MEEKLEDARAMLLLGLSLTWFGKFPIFLKKAF